jgi:hypothetical protein
VTDQSYGALTLLVMSALVIGFAGLRAGAHRTKLQLSFDPSVTDRTNLRFSIAQFDQMVRDKTRAQIGDEYGPPDGVNDNGDSWLYYNLQVFDEDLGSRMTVRIRFAGTGGPRDFVVVAEFW